ncbi:dimer_Tnp_hAT domain-containing protein [Trichonephila clavipes]|nr:dimer_Tnp_hAT domain-containing protein [Trichonephila clavipes]
MAGEPMACDAIFCGYCTVQNNTVHCKVLVLRTNASDRSWGGSDLIPDIFNYLKNLAYAILTLFSSTYAYESLFSEMSNIKDFLRNRLADHSDSACILLKVTSYNPNKSYLFSNL